MSISDRAEPKSRPPGASGAAISEPSRPPLIALLGNPNVGKTSLFNQLTGLRQKVGNYPGVTVERREGRLRGRHGRSETLVLDLPGTNSLAARSPDEQVVAKVLQGEVSGIDLPTTLVVVVDASRPRRGLFLLTQALEWGLPILVCLNMTDEAARDGVSLNARTLAEQCGVPVVECIATKHSGVTDLIHALESGVATVGTPLTLPGIQGLPPASSKRWNQLRDVVRETELDDEEISARYRQVNQWVAEARPQQGEAQRRSSDRLDRLFLHPFLGPALFLIVMGAVFQAVFTLGDAPMGWIESLFGAASDLSRSVLPEGLFADFLADGVIAGVGGVLVFLPQILILFLFLGILEDSGYMTRAAFLVDRPLRLVGLSGRSFIPLLSSFACAIPGIMATRAIENRRERLITTLVAPLMTCSARLPVYTILIGTFIEERTVLGFWSLQAMVLLGLYLVGVVLAALAALVINFFLKRAGQTPGVLEMAPYRRPSLKSVLIRMWQRALMFVKRAGTVILAMSIVIWILMTFPQMDRPEGMDDATFVAKQQAQSYAGRLGHAIEPAIEPLGYDWRIGIGLVGSLAAREVFVSTMSIVYAVEETEDEDAQETRVGEAMRASRWDESGRPVYSLATVLSLLAFYAIALQCISTIAIVYKETGSVAWTAGQFLVFTALAWVVAFITYRLAL